MKYFIRILLFSSVFFTACTKQENEVLLKELNEIKAMGDTLPLAAMRRLDSIKPLFENETEYTRNKLALLEIRLQDKAYITHTTNKQIKNICRFFEENGTSIDKQEAYYYMGSVYRDLNDYPNAVTYFLKSTEIAEINMTDYALLQNAYSQLSYLYKTQFNYTEALDAALKQLDIAIRNGAANERTYMNVASSYYELKDTLQTVEYTDSAMDCIKHNQKFLENADILASALGKYSVAGERIKADFCYDLLKKIPKESQGFNYLSNLAFYYENFASVDSASAAMQELYNTTRRIESKHDASLWLTRYYASIKDYEKATEFAIKFIEANMAVNNKRNLEHTTNAKNFFQYRRDKEEETRVMQKAAKDRYNLALGVSISAILLLGTVTLHYRHKKRLLDIILSKEENIESAKVLIEQKEKELTALNSANARLTKELQDANDSSRQLIAQNCNLTRMTLMNSIAKNDGDIIEKVKQTSKGKYRLNDEEWKKLLGAIDKLYPEFTHEVQAKFRKINEPLLRVCYLLKIGLNGPQIANLTDYPRQTVWDRIKKVKETMELEATSSQRN